MRALRGDAELAPLIDDDEDRATRALLAQACEAIGEPVPEIPRAIDRRLLPSVPTVRPEKTGRNDPCSCGSGKKFKKCHGSAG